MARFNLARYNHHSTLLYAVPPSSIGCLDLLVGINSWAGGSLGERAGRQRSSAKEDEELVPLPLSTESLDSYLPGSLARLAEIRSDLIGAWGLRNRQTTILEEEASHREFELEGDGYETPTDRIDWGSTSISSGGIEHKKPAKSHQVNRSVGGRLRDLLSSSGNSTSLESWSRTKTDVDLGKLRQILQPALEEDVSLAGRTSPSYINDNGVSYTFPYPTSTPPVSPNDSALRPGLPSRHSVHVAREAFLPTPFNMLANSQSPTARFGGVGGLDGAGDEDEKRDEVGRKKEGVLWGAGVWEGMTKGSGKGKWESESELSLWAPMAPTAETTKQSFGLFWTDRAFLRSASD